MLQVAVVYTIACIILSGNAVLSFWPNIVPGFRAPPVVLYIEGVLSVMSCGLFLIGGVFSFMEVLKAKRGERLQNVIWQNYGTVVEEDDVADEAEKVEEKCRRESIRVAVTEMLERTTSLARTISLTGDNGAPHDIDPNADARLTWQSLPTLHELRTHYLSQLQFLASLISVTSSFVYTVTAILALISIFMTHTIATWIRFPQLAAAVGFALSSWLAMVQAQRSWWRPALKTMVWHANLLNLVGSLGFIFCSVLGLLRHHWAEWQFGCTFLWGSWAFLIASAMSSYNAWRKERAKAVEDSKV